MTAKPSRIRHQATDTMGVLETRRTNVEVKCLVFQKRLNSGMRNKFSFYIIKGIQIDASKS